MIGERALAIGNPLGLGSGVTEREPGDRVRPALQKCAGTARVAAVMLGQLPER